MNIKYEIDATGGSVDFDESDIVNCGNVDSAINMIRDCVGKDVQMNVSGYIDEDAVRSEIEPLFKKSKRR